jgi:hypothetical protein
VALEPIRSTVASMALFSSSTIRIGLQGATSSTRSMAWCQACSAQRYDEHRKRKF